MAKGQRKRFVIAAIMTAVLYSPFLLAADPCDDVEKIVVNRVNPNWKTDLLKTLSDYDVIHQDKYRNGTYYLCFDFSEGALKVDQPLSLTLKDDHNVFLSGLKLSRDANFSSSSPLLTLQNDRMGQTLELRASQLANVVSGVALSGSGRIELHDVEVAGDGSRSGGCVDVRSTAALLDGVTASSCNEGVAIAAPGVKIAASKIFNNKLGVHVMDSYATEVEQSTVYANDDGDKTTLDRTDGIRFDTKLSHGINLMKNEKEPVAEGKDAVIYLDTPAFLQITVPKGKNADGKIEFLVSDDIVCGMDPKSQPCELVNDKEFPSMPIAISEADLKKGPMTFKVSANYEDTNLVAIYTNGALGSAGISREFKFALGNAHRDISVIIAMPESLPIPMPGAREEGPGREGPGDEVEDEPGGGDRMAGGAGPSGTDAGGGIIGGGASPSPSPVSCALAPDSPLPFRRAALLAAALLGIVPALILSRRTVNSVFSPLRGRG